MVKCLARKKKTINKHYDVISTNPMITDEYSGHFVQYTKYRYFIPVEMYLSSTFPMRAALQALIYWVSVRPELINPCKTLNKNDSSVSLYKCQLQKFQSFKNLNILILILPQIGYVLSTNDATGIPSKGMTSHTAYADTHHMSMLQGIKRWQL